MTQLNEQEKALDNGSRRGLVIGLAAAVVGLVALVVVLQLTSSNDDPVAKTTEVSTPSASPYKILLAEYAAARNAGDIGALTELLALRAEQKRHPLEPWDGGKRHPLDPLGYLNGVSEIREVEGQVPAVQGSGSGVEFFDIEVNENAVSAPDVEFRWRFFYGADGTESGGEAGCVGGERGAAFIEDGKFAVLDWGFEDPGACES